MLLILPAQFELHKKQEYFGPVSSDIKRSFEINNEILIPTDK